MVGSISPINGNNPSFTVAEIDAATAQLKDYQVFVASNQTGVDTQWSEEYDFAKAYKEPAFTAATVADLVAGFKADPTAQSAQARVTFGIMVRVAAGREQSERSGSRTHARSGMMARMRFGHAFVASRSDRASLSVR